MHRMLTKVLDLCESKKQQMGSAAAYQSSVSRSLVPTREVDKATDMVTIERVAQTPDMYLPLENALLEEELYVVVDMEQYLPKAEAYTRSLRSTT